MTVGVLAEALVRWQHAAGPFWPYVCAAPFLGLGESEQLVQRVTRRPLIHDGGVARRSARMIALADELLGRPGLLPPLRAGDAVGAGPERACESNDIRAAQRGWEGEVSQPDFPVILADLPAEPLLAIAPLLAVRGWYVVPVVQRWIATPAVLPCRRLLTRLVIGAMQVRRPAEPRGAILIADGERTGPVGYPELVSGRTFDNRYEYQICRFPSARFLEAQGVRCVHWLTQMVAVPPAGSGLESMTLGLPPVARDLHPYREALLQAGIDVKVTPWPPA